MIALVISLTLVGTIIMAKLVGSSLPLLASKVGFDPAVMANPLISTVCDSLWRCKADFASVIFLN